jgi:hypothetical protein
VGSRFIDIATSPRTDILAENTGIQSPWMAFVMHLLTDFWLYVCKTAKAALLPTRTIYIVTMLNCGQRGCAEVRGEPTYLQKQKL